MIKHIVMWNVRGDTPEIRAAAARFVKEQFEGLHGLIPGLRTLEIGIDVSRVSYACDVVLYSEFDDEKSLVQYATHPAHTNVREKLGDIRTARYQVDYFPVGV